MRDIFGTGAFLWLDEISIRKILSAYALSLGYSTARRFFDAMVTHDHSIENWDSRERTWFAHCRLQWWKDMRDVVHMGNTGQAPTILKIQNTILIPETVSRTFGNLLRGGLLIAVEQDSRGVFDGMIKWFLTDQQTRLVTASRNYKPGLCVAEDGWVSFGNTFHMRKTYMAILYIPPVSTHKTLCGLTRKGCEGYMTFKDWVSTSEFKSMCSEKSELNGNAYSVDFFSSDYVADAHAPELATPDTIDKFTQYLHTFDAYACADILQTAWALWNKMYEANAKREARALEQIADSRDFRHPWFYGTRKSRAFFKMKSHFMQSVVCECLEVRSLPNDLLRRILHFGTGVPAVFW